MPAYIILVNLTDQGIRNAKDTVKRAKAAEQALEAVGGRKIGIWWTMGQYDMVFIAEGPDDETAMRVVLGVAMQGNVHTTTLKAFSEEEMAHIVAGLP
jgi:uncharacterized protein with GYD domain